VGKHINDLSKEDWKDLYLAQGKTLSELGVLFGVHTTTIYNRLHKLGVERRACGNKKTFDITKEELENFYSDKKMSFIDIAKVYGCTEASIRRKVADFSIERNLTPSDVLTEEFLRKYIDSGVPIRRIEEDTGFSYPIIYTYLHKFGFPVGKSKKRKLVGQENEVISGYLYGFTTTQLADKYSVSLGVITRILKSNSVEIRPSNAFNKKVGNISELCIMYFDNGLQLSKIAEFFGCSKAAVYLQFKRHGVQLRSKSDAVSGENNGMFGKKQSEDTRHNMSNAFVNEVRSVHTCCEETIETPYQGTKRVRSSWEAAVARYFDFHGTKYLYEPKRFKLPNGLSYLPDFFILAENKYIEVKGWYRDDYRKKVDLFEGMGNTIEVWELDVLVEMGILNKGGVAII